jgi:RimJ/RimL family protein N-acetyltransferase
MEFSKYGIRLNRLKEDDIDLVRRWRNSPQIQQYMEYREYITPEMQKEWFRSVNNFDNFFFIIHYEGKKIGLINSSNVNWKEVTSDGGIFIWEEEYYDTFVPVWASLCLLETDIFVFNATRSYIKTLKDNQRAITLNTHLGYELMSGQEEVYNQQYILTKENFEMKAKKIMKAASLLVDAKDRQLVIFYDRDDFKSGMADFMIGKMNKKMIKTYREVSEGRRYFIKPSPFSSSADELKGKAF